MMPKQFRTKSIAEFFHNIYPTRQKVGVRGREDEDEEDQFEETTSPPES